MRNLPSLKPLPRAVQALHPRAPCSSLPEWYRPMALSQWPVQLQPAYCPTLPESRPVLRPMLPLKGAPVDLMWWEETVPPEAMEMFKLDKQLRREVDLMCGIPAEWVRPNPAKETLAAMELARMNGEALLRTHWNEHLQKLETEVVPRSHWMKETDGV